MKDISDWIIAFCVGMLLGMTVFPAKADDGLFLELGAGRNNQPGVGRNPQSVIRVRYEQATPWWAPDVLEWDHHSSIPDGWPFNHNLEDTTDQVSLVWRFQLWKGSK